MKQEDLIPGKGYELVYSDCFCHCIDIEGSKGASGFKAGTYTFVGAIRVSGINTLRNIFYSPSGGGGCAYVMFSARNLDYIVDPKKELVRNFMNNINLTKEDLIKIINEL